MDLLIAIIIVSTALPRQFSTQPANAMTQHRFDQAIALIDAANREDPSREICEGKEWSKELLYAHRMSQMLERFAPDADDAMQLAVRAQHIQRWKSPRSDYPMDRKGYHQWRATLNQFHLLDFANKHSEYDEQKWIDIIDKIQKKMSAQARRFVLDGHIALPDSMVELIWKVIVE